MDQQKDKDERPLAYPKPTETDLQMQNQDEYTERQSSSNSEDLPRHGGTGQQSNRNEGNTQSTEGIP